MILVHAVPCHGSRRSRAVLWDRGFFLLRTALKDRPKGPSTANRHQPPTATDRQPPTTANRHQPPIPNHQLPPTTINRHQPPSTASRQSPTTNRQPPTYGVPMGIFGKLGYRTPLLFFSFSSLRTALSRSGLANDCAAPYYNVMDTDGRRRTALLYEGSTHVVIVGRQALPHEKYFHLSRETLVHASSPN